MNRFIPIIVLLACAPALAVDLQSQTVTTTIRATSNTTYNIVGKLTRTNAGFIIDVPDGSVGVVIKNAGGELNGGGIHVGTTTGTLIDGVTIRNTFNAGDGDNGGAGSAISVMGDFTNGTIKNCKLYNSSATALWLWTGLDNATIANNLIDGAGEGIHWFGRGGKTNHNPAFTNNTVLRVRRHAFEFQCYGKTYGLRIANNFAGEWVTQPSWNGHMAFSIAMGGAQSPIEPDKGAGPYINEGMIVEGNVAETTGDLLTKFKNGTTPPYNSCAFELMGDAFIFRNNFSNGWPSPTLVEYVGPGWSAEGNTFLSYPNLTIKPGAGGDKSFEICAGVGYNSGPTKLNNFLGMIGDKPVPKAGVDVPVTPPTNTVVSNLVTTANFNSIDLHWTVSGTGSFSIQRFTSNGAVDNTFTAPPGLASGTTSYHDAQFSPSQISSTWRFFYRVGGVQGATVQIGVNPNPDPPPLANEMTWPAMFNGAPVQAVSKRNADGSFTTPTTRPSGATQPSN